MIKREQNPRSSSSRLGSLSIAEMSFSPLGTKISKRKRWIKFRSPRKKNWVNKVMIPLVSNLHNRRSLWTTTSSVNCFWRWNASRRSTSWPSGKEEGRGSLEPGEWVVAGFKPCSNPATAWSPSPRGLQCSLKLASWMSITLTWAQLSMPQRCTTSSLRVCRKLSMREMRRISSY